jgi:hypothetical protein
MDGRKASPTAYTYTYPAGSHTWTCPASGQWRFVLWGAGGGGDNATTAGGGSGALYSGKRFIARGQTVAVVVGANNGLGNGANSTATLPGGEVFTAGGGGANAVAGTVTANQSLDIVYAGSAGGTGSGGSGASGLGDAGGAAGAGSGGFSGGAGAPGYGSFRGGDGQAGGATRSAEVPGGGGAMNGLTGNPGGDGMVVIYRET